MISIFTACIIVVAFQVVSAFRIFPKNLDTSYHSQGLNELFCWRWIETNQGLQKVLTVEQGTPDLEDDRVTGLFNWGYNFRGRQLLTHQQYNFLRINFEINSLTLADNRTYKVLKLIRSYPPVDNFFQDKFDTLENALRKQEEFLIRDANRFGRLISPLDLVGTNGYRTDLNSTTKFGTKKINLINNNFMLVVTLED